MKEVIRTSIFFLRGTIRLGLELNMVFKFYARVAKMLKLKVRKFSGLLSTFAEVTGGGGGGRGVARAFVPLLSFPLPP